MEQCYTWRNLENWVENLKKMYQGFSYSSITQYNPVKTNRTHRPPWKSTWQTSCSLFKKKRKRKRRRNVTGTLWRRQMYSGEENALANELDFKKALDLLAFVDSADERRALRSQVVPPFFCFVVCFFRDRLLFVAFGVRSTCRCPFPGSGSALLLVSITEFLPSFRFFFLGIWDWTRLLGFT